MDYFNRKFNGQLIPLHIEYFAVYDPLLSHETALEDRSIIAFITPSVQVQQRDFHEKQRELGMIDGLYKFSKEFNQDQTLDFIELNDKVVIVNVVQDRYYLMLSVKLNKCVEDDSNDEIEYNRLNMAPLKFLQDQMLELYAIFKLHHGEMKELFENLKIEEFQDVISNYFRLCFTDKFQLNISENGFLKNFKSVRTSSLTIDYNLTNFINKKSQLFCNKELLIWNDNQENLNEYGLVYKYLNNLTEDSLKDLMIFIQKNDHFNSLNKDDLLQSYVPTERRIQVKISKSDDQIYNPFKTVMQTINDFTEITGLNYGVDTLNTGLSLGVDTLNSGISSLSSGFNMINDYIPFTPNFENSNNEHYSDPQIPTSELLNQDVEFLIGLQSNGTITYKNIYLKFKENPNIKLYKLVIFKILNFKFLMIYDFEQNCINEIEYYEKLSMTLFKIHQNYLLNQQKKIKEVRNKFYYIESYPEENRLTSNLPSLTINENYDDFLIHKALYRYWAEESSKESFFKYKNWNIWIYHHPTSQAVLIMLKNTNITGKSSYTNIKITEEAMIKRLQTFRNH